MYKGINFTLHQSDEQDIKVCKSEWETRKCRLTFLCLFFFKSYFVSIYISVGAEQMAQWLRAITALPETQVGLSGATW